MTKQDRLFSEIQLKPNPRPQIKSNSQVVGYGLLVIALGFGFLFLYGVLFSKLMPVTGISVLDAIRNDYYFCYLIPLSIVPTFAVIYLNWLAISHFVQN